MATEDLYDPKAVTDEILAGLKTRLADSDVGSKDTIEQAISDPLRELLESQLRTYNTQYRDTVVLYDNAVDETRKARTEYEQREAQLKENLVIEKETHSKSLQATINGLQKQVDHLANAADKERAEYAKEKEKLNTLLKKAETERDEAGRARKQAEKDREIADNSWQELKDENDRLNNQLKTTEGELRDHKSHNGQLEAALREVVDTREKANHQLKEVQLKFQALTQANGKLQQERNKLKLDRDEARKKMDEQEKKIKTLETDIKDKEEVIHGLKPDSPTEIKTTGAAFAAAELGGDRLGYNSDSDTAYSRPDTPKDAPDSEELRKEREEHQRLQARIETDYVPRAEHAKVVQELGSLKTEITSHQKSLEEKAKHIESLEDKRNKLESEIGALKEKIKKLEKDNTSCETERKQLRAYKTQKENEDKLQKKDDAKIKDLEKRIKALDQVIATQKAENDKYRNRVAELEKLEREQKTTIVELKNRPETASKSIQAGLPDPSQQQKDDEIKAHEAERSALVKKLQDELAETRADLQAAANQIATNLSGVTASEQEVVNLRTQLAQRVKEVQNLTDDHNKYEELFEEADTQRRDLKLISSLLKNRLQDSIDAQDFLVGQLDAANESCVRFRDALKAITDQYQQPEFDYDSVEQSLTAQLRDFIEVRQQALKLQSKMIRLAQEAAARYQTLSGSKFTVQGYTEQAANEYYVEANKFEDSIRQLSDRYATLITKVQEEAHQLRERVLGNPDNAPALEAAETMKKQVQELTAKNEELKRLLQECRETNHIADGPDADHDDILQKIKQLLRQFLVMVGPSIADLDELLLDIARLRREAPGPDNGPRNGDEELAKALQKLEGSERERRRLEVLVTTLQEAASDQNTVIDNNAQQADRTQAALGEQIAVFEKAQQELMQEIEKRSASIASQGRTAAEMNRALAKARREVGMFKTLVQTLTEQRNLLQDEIRACREAQQRARQRLLANEGGTGASTGTIGGRVGGITGVLSSLTGFTVETMVKFRNTVQHIGIWGFLLTLAALMITVTIAEGRRHAEWRHANAHTRGLWMAIEDEHTICLSPPNFDYFWHTVLVALSGRWMFR
jgi:chromosome segregation ATPase